MLVRNRTVKTPPSADVVEAVRAELAPVRRQERAEHAQNMAAASSAIETAHRAGQETAALRQQFRALRARSVA